MQTQHVGDHYGYLLPPGWFRFDLRSPLAPQIDDLMREWLDQVPRDQAARVRHGAAEQLAPALRQAADGGAFDLVVPGPSDNPPGLGSFVIAPLAWPDGVDAVEGLTAIAAADPSAALVEMHELLALRTEVFVERAAEADATVVSARTGLGVRLPVTGRSFRVQYFIGHPDRRGEWISVLFSIPVPEGQDGDDYVRAQAQVVDAIVTTFRML